jgi:uncharacterized protein YjbI with pentapeptide repeats
MPEGPPPAGRPADANPYDALAAGDASAKRALVLRLIAGHAEGRLNLPAKGGTGARLEGIDLSRQGLKTLADVSAGPVPWWDAERQSANLRRADLRGGSLRQANLQGAALEEADAAGADLAGADLRGALLAGANLDGAMLEEALLQDASLRFARLAGAVLEGARLRQADLWGAQARGADFAGADLQGAVLEEADFEGADLRNADLRGAVLKRANFRRANLHGADLQGAVLGGTNFHEAVLREARLEELSLIGCDIARIHVSDAWLGRTRLHQGQLGGAIGEDLAGEYEPARRGYLALERTFEELGDPDAASWAYRKKRRMQKWDNLRQARHALAAGHVRAAAAFYLRYGLDLLVEWTCDYGESLPRVLGSLVAVFVLFIVAYGVTGTVSRVEEGSGQKKVYTPTRDPGELAIFSLTAVAMPGNPPTATARPTTWGTSWPPSRP